MPGNRGARCAAIRAAIAAANRTEYCVFTASSSSTDGRGLAAFSTSLITMEPSGGLKKGLLCPRVFKPVRETSAHTDELVGGSSIRTDGYLRAAALAAIRSIE